MLSQWRRLRAEIPASFLAALALGGGFLGFVAWDQSHWWQIKPDYSFGWLVPLLAAYVVYDRWPRIRARIAGCMAEDSPRAAGAWRWPAAGAAALVLAAGVPTFLLGALYRAAKGTSQPGTFALTLGAIAIAGPLLFFNAPAAARPSRASLATDARFGLLACFVFPLGVWLVSAPLVSAVETQLNLALLRGIVIVVAFVFELLGIAIEQRGNILDLPFGSVGVEEACSGIRSLTACVFAGSFVSALFVERVGKKIALVIAAVVFGLLANLGRSLFLTAWAYRHAGGIPGRVHDAAGYAVLAITVAGLLWLTARMKPRPPPSNAFRELPESKKA